MWLSLNTWPQNLVTMGTLCLSSIIAGLVPFQILNNATSQLVDQVKIANSIASEEEQKRKGLALYGSTQAIKIKDDLGQVARISPLDGNILNAASRTQALKDYFDGFI